MKKRNSFKKNKRGGGLGETAFNGFQFMFGLGLLAFIIILILGAAGVNAVKF